MPDYSQRPFVPSEVEGPATSAPHGVSTSLDTNGWGIDHKALFELFRFYQAALVNTAFGYGLYALLLWLGLDRYLAQAIAQVCGTAFNYVTYSRHVFHEQHGSPWRFVAVYVANYGINLLLLAGVSLWVRSPYAAGLVATLAASLINYAALKFVVFGRAAHPA